ncbi:MAG: aryl-sulfate sulfotransferase [Chitinophagales bacterium]
MKNIILIGLALLPLLLSAQVKYQYLSPVPGSKNITIEHNIIIREGSIIKASSLHEQLFTIHGSKSGNHSFTMKFCRDTKTILLQPTIPFAYDEKVTVAIAKGLQSERGHFLNEYSFNFSTHRQYTDIEQANFKNAKKILQEQERQMYAVGNQDINAGESTRGPVSMFEITVNDNPSPGDIFFDALNEIYYNNSWNGYHVISSDGDSVYSKALTGVTDFKLEYNGNLAVGNGKENRYEELDSNFSVIGKIVAVNGYTTDFHECQITPDHHVFIIAGENQTVDMTVYDPDYKSNALVLGMVIQEFDPDGNLIFEWRSFDHIEITEAQHINLGFFYIDYIHANSIEIDNDGNIIVSNRHLDQVNKIDINTGDFIWRLGGQLNEFTFINDLDKFNYQHDCRRLANGNITLWDNGNFYTPAHSQAKEYQLDEVNKTATLVWSYGHPGGNNGNTMFYFAGGNAQRLPNGNTFINGGWRLNPLNPSMFEVTPDSTIVWEMKLNSDSDLTSYRGHRFKWKPCARPTLRKMTTKDITVSSATLKWNEVAGAKEYHLQYKKHLDALWKEKIIDAGKHSKKVTQLDANTKYDWRIETWCNFQGTKTSGYTEIKKFTTLPQRTTDLTEQPLLTFSVFPNPSRDQISISSNAIVNQVRILDLTGREVRNQFTEEQQVNLSVGDLASGNYLVIVRCDQQQGVQKLVIE